MEGPQQAELAGVDALSADAQKRVRRAVECARKAVLGERGLTDIYLKRFHRAMDALRTPEEGAAVRATLSVEPWYERVAEKLPE